MAELAPTRCGPIAGRIRSLASWLEDTLHGGRIEVLEEPLDPSRGDVDDEADRRCDEIAGRELPVKDVALHEATPEELARQHLVAKLRDAPGEVSEQRQILLACLGTARDVVPDLRFRGIDLANRFQVAPFDRSKE